MDDEESSAEVRENETASNGSKPRLAERRDVADVYAAAEDSKLLADTVVEHLDGDEVVLDVGTGTGYVGRRIREEVAVSVVGVDINPVACRQAAQTGLPVVRGNLVDPFASDTFDVVVCNPPYLPTDPEREWDDLMERALSGGPDGLAVVRPLLETVSRVLGEEGTLYLLVSNLTDPTAVRSLAESVGLTGEEVAVERHPFEALYVLRFDRYPSEV